MAEGSALAGAIDTHTHLNHPRLLRRIHDVLARAREAGIDEMLVVGYDVPSSGRAVELAQEFDFLWAAVGMHPHDASALDELSVQSLRDLAGSKKVVAVGETGLDFYRDLSPRHVQEAAFRDHLSLAAELELPAIVHCRNAEEAVLSVLESADCPIDRHRVVWHCFDGSAAMAERALALGVRLGFGGLLTRRSAGELRSIARDAPLESILVETDCPYLVPRPSRSSDNEPANLRYVIECVAEARGEAPQHVAAATADNARRVFGLLHS
jgi:TatD DNase family protein